MFKDSVFSAFEWAGWQRAVESYHKGYGHLTVQAGSKMLESFGAGPGTRLLDMACGPGYLTALASRMGASAVGIDFSSEMIKLARRMSHSLDFALGDCSYLPFKNASFDAAVMNFGIHHVEFPERALGEAYNVLKVGGRVAFTHWARADQALIFPFFRDAIAQYGDREAPRPPSTPFDRFNDPDECRRILIAADFIKPQVELVPQTWRFQTFDELFDAVYNGTVRLSATLRVQPAGNMEMIRENVRQKVEAYRHNGVIELPMAAMLACATKG